jgi:hypothetical protein
MGEVLYAPLFKKNLFLVGQVADKRIATTYTRDISCHLTTQEWKGEVILTRVRWGKFYRLQMTIVVPKFGSHEDWQ